MSPSHADDQAVSTAALVEGLTSLGLDNRPVVAHTSLKAFGHVAGGPNTVVDALLATADTVMAPAFCFEPNWAPPPDDRPARNGCDYGYYDGWSRPRIPWVVESASIDSSMGTVPCALASRPGTYRSDNPWHSWLANGIDADTLVTPHPWDEPHLPLARLSARGGYVALLGVGLTACTAVHLAEEMAGRHAFIRWMVDRDDAVRRIRVGGCSKGFDRLWPECSDLFAEAAVGRATLRAAPLAPLLERLAGVIRENPGVTVCSNSCIRCRDAVLGGPTE